MAHPHDQRGVGESKSLRSPVVRLRPKKSGDFDLAQIPAASAPGKNKHVLYQADSSIRREVACDWLHPLDRLLASNRIDGIGSNLIDCFRL
jgi:hypothetical protein